jgi:hypothetical protein
MIDSIAREAVDQRETRDGVGPLQRHFERDPAVATERLSRTSDGRVRYTLKTPYRDA